MHSRLTLSQCLGSSKIINGNICQLHNLCSIDTYIHRYAFLSLLMVKHHLSVHCGLWAPNILTLRNAITWMVMVGGWGLIRGWIGLELGRSGGINLINGNVLAHNLFHSENKIIIIIINQWQVRSSNIHFYIKYIRFNMCFIDESQYSNHSRIEWYSERVQ